MNATTKKAEVMDLAIQIKGEIVNSNFDDFKAVCLERIEGMKYELLTDGDFTKAKEDIKNLQTTEKALKEAEEDALKQMGDVYSLIDGIREIQKASADCRLAKSREVKKRDAEMKNQIIDDALAMIDHPKRLAYRQKVMDGAKGKRSFKTMAEGANAVAESYNTEILKSREVIEQFISEHGKTLVPDQISLELQDSDNVVNELRYRLEKQRDEAEKKRLKAEADKLKAEADAELPVTSTQLPAQDDAATGSAVTAANTVSGNHLDKRVLPSADDSSEAGNMTAEQEWKHFITEVPAVFIQFRQLRLALKHGGNQTKALKMAEAVNQAFIEMKNGDGLLAAAPEMLEALQNIENDDNHIPAKIWNLIQSSIAKATGKEVK